MGIITLRGGVIGPIAAGFIISKIRKIHRIYNYFCYILGLFSFGCPFLSFFLKRRSAEGKYCFGRILQERKNNKNWKHITGNAHFFQGLREGTFAFIIWVFCTYRPEAKWLWEPSAL